MSAQQEFDLIVLAEEREMIERGDISRISEIIHSFHQFAKNYEGNIAFAIDGYDDDPRELYEISEVRRWFAKLDKEFPYMMYFLSEQLNMPLLYVAMFVPFEKKPAGLLFQSKSLVAFLRRKGMAIVNFCELIGDNPMPIITRISKRFGVLA